MSTTTKWTSFRAAVTVALGGALLGCSGLVASAIGADAPYLPDGQTRCRVGASQERPLIIEWPASDRADLELALGRGLVAVRYSGCEMKLLRRCAAPGGYRYRGTTRELTQDSIRSADELYAKLPLGAVSLEGAVERGAELTVSTTVVGQYLADRETIARPELQGPECAEATHVITGLTAGAFEFFSSKQGAVRGGLELAAARAEAERVLMRRAGDPDACRASTETDTEPPDNCGALLRVEVRRVECAADERYREGHGCEPRSATSEQGAPARPGALAAQPEAAKRSTARPPHAPLVTELGGALVAVAVSGGAHHGWACERSLDGEGAEPSRRAALFAATERPVLVASALLVGLRSSGSDDAGRGASLEAFWLSDARGTTRTVVQQASLEAPRLAPDHSRGEVWVESAAGPIGTMTRELLGRMTGSPCALTPPTRSDLRALALGPAELDLAQGLLPSLASRTSEACELVRHAEGRWMLALERVGALVSLGTRRLTLEAPLGQERGRLCFGTPTRSWL